MKTVSAFVLTCTLLALSTTVVLAKRGSIGIYAIVDSVELLPNEESPQQIRIRGVFVVPVQLSSGDYQPPQRGYLYFTLPSTDAPLAQQEWQRLKALAGTNKGIGFGPYFARYPAGTVGPMESLRVRVHDAHDVAEPDVYPEPRGVIETGDRNDPDFDAILAELHAAATN